MIKKTTSQSPPTLNVGGAVRLLCTELGGTERSWTKRLVNWRRPERQGQAPFTYISGPRPTYLESDILRYVERMKHQKTALQCDPLDGLPNASAQVIRNQDARLIIQLSWRDTNTSGVLALTIAAAEDLAQSLNAAIAEHVNKFSGDFDQGMEQDVENFAYRSSRTDDSGELPTLEEALKKS